MSEERKEYCAGRTGICHAADCPSAARLPQVRDLGTIEFHDGMDEGSAARGREGERVDESWLSLLHQLREANRRVDDSTPVELRFAVTAAHVFAEEIAARPRSGPDGGGADGLR